MEKYHIQFCNLVVAYGNGEKERFDTHLNLLQIRASIPTSVSHTTLFKDMKLLAIHLSHNEL